MTSSSTAKSQNEYYVARGVYVVDGLWSMSETQFGGSIGREKCVYDCGYESLRVPANDPLNRYFGFGLMYSRQETTRSGRLIWSRKQDGMVVSPSALKFVP